MKIYKDTTIDNIINSYNDFCKKQGKSKWSEEDEKVRKNCIHFLELQKSHHASTIEIDECIAWLEKQGEHESAIEIYLRTYNQP